MKKRRKVNNLCRCTPKAGIIALHPDYARHVYDQELRRILLSGNPGYIAEQAIQVGDILRNAGRPLLALQLMETAFHHLLNVDDDMQRDYALEHYCPINPNYFQWYHPWSARVSEVDALRLADRIDHLYDEITHHLGREGHFHLRSSVHRYYENLFEDIYEW